MVIRVVDQDAEDDAAEQFATVLLSISPLRLQQFYEFEIARAGLAIGPLGERHRRDEV